MAINADTVCARLPPEFQIELQIETFKLERDGPRAPNERLLLTLRRPATIGRESCTHREALGRLQMCLDMSVALRALIPGEGELYGGSKSNFESNLQRAGYWRSIVEFARRAGQPRIWLPYTGRHSKGAFLSLSLRQ